MDFFFFVYIISVTPLTCPDLNYLFMPINASNLYVAAYSNSNPSNSSSDWLPVISCTSTIGSSSSPTCSNGINVISSTSCYIKLDIQIAYTNIGSIFNPQPVLSAVIFHYQAVVSENLVKSFTFLFFMFLFTGSKRDIIFYFTCNGKRYFSRYIKRTYY